MNTQQDNQLPHSENSPSRFAVDVAVSSQAIMQQTADAGLRPSARSPFAQLAADRTASADVPPVEKLPLEAVQTFAAPDHVFRIRCLLSDQVVDSFFYSAPTGMYSARQEGPRVRVSGPWTDADIVLHVGQQIGPVGCAPSTLKIPNLTVPGLAALMTCFDVLRYRILQSMLNRQPVGSMGVTFAHAAEQLRAARTLADRRWLLRLLKEFLPTALAMPDAQFRHGFGELCQLSLLSTGGPGNSLIPSEALLEAATSLLSPLPAVVLGAPPAAGSLQVGRQMILIRGRSLFAVEHSANGQQSQSSVRGFGSDEFEDTLGHLLNRFAKDATAAIPSAPTQPIVVSTLPTAEPSDQSNVFATQPSRATTPATISLQQTTTCPGCSRVTPAHRFCAHCGYPL